VLVSAGLPDMDETQSGLMFVTLTQAFPARYWLAVRTALLKPV